MRRMLAALLVAVCVGVFGVSAPALADTTQEMQSAPFCQDDWHQMFDAGYWYTPGGTSYRVYYTSGSQVGPSWSNCEDINVFPNVGAGYFMTSAYARTYMCGSSGCWFNAWRWCGGGCVTATNMINGTWYEVHIAFVSVGTDWLRIYD